jgi:hypothetical protein
MADPEDQWLQNALSEIAVRTNSEYSVVGGEENFNLNVKIIKTKGNIIVQDEIMKKIIRVISVMNHFIG